MPTARYNIKIATRQELDFAIEWAAREGWNPGLHDADCYYTVDQQGFLLGYLDEEPIASLSAVKYGQVFGFLGFYIVKPGFRGQGYGKALWNAAIHYLAGCNIGLDGVVEQQAHYKEMGFNLAFRNIRFCCQGGGEPPGLTGIVKLDELPLAVVASYDRPFFPARREVFLKAWISQPDCVSLGIMEGSQLAGMGVLRKCREGYKLGPLYADSPEGAEALFLALKATVLPADPIYLDVPEINPLAIEFVTRHAMRPEFETARIYAGPQPEMPLRKIFGITSFEIG